MIKTVLGILLLLLAAVVLLYNPPRAKKKRRQRASLATTIAIVGLSLLGAQALGEQKQSEQRVDNSTVEKTTNASSQPLNTLRQLNYNQDQEVVLNNNNPGFTEAELNSENGPWTNFSNLDSLNRVGKASALLNRSLMPHEKRERLFVRPTGWHNKRLNDDWLFNRSHLIGYQLSGENNNPKNLMTGTRSLNSPLMQTREDDIAAYLKESPKHYVRYEVLPVFRDTELLARGVAMRAQSIGDDRIRFNIYIFNVEPGVTLNYADGTSRRS